MDTALQQKIQKLKKEQNAIILAHTYQPGEVQDLADYVGDSYGLSVKAAETDADVIVFCGVDFMAETAAILSPSKKVILPEPDASCPMADMITADELREFKAQYPDYLVMCYVNSTAEIKALSDICCTSSNALKIVRQIPKDRGILFVPDKHLGSWVQEQTGHTMVMWNGFCPTHVRIRPETIAEMKKKHPAAPVLIHPESEKECRDMADAVLSTGGMCEYVKESDKQEFIIATEIGITHTLKKQNPGKQFYPVDAVVVCPNMKKGSLDSTVKALEGVSGQVVKVPDDIAWKAKASLVKMLEMSK
ncbi:MAG: quinolinate synthase NadA [Chitinivibrionales bacterium]